MKRHETSNEEGAVNHIKLRVTPWFISYLLLLLFVAFVFSCATAPKASFSAEDENRELSLLPAGAKLYLWADAVKGRPLLDVLSFEGMSGKDAARMLDSTGTAAAAVFSEGQGRRFFLAATGDYPRVRANFSLIFTRGWNKLKGSGGNSYWYSQNDKIALALGAKLALVSDTDPWAPPSEKSPAEIPQAFMEFRRPLVLAGWIPNPSQPINGFLDSMGIPVQIPAEGFFFGAARIPAEKNSTDSAAAGKGPWELVFRIKTPSASSARSLLGLFSMARLFVSRGTGAVPVPGLSADKGSISPQEAVALLFANAPEQDGEFLTLRIGSLDEGKIASLFKMFSVKL